MTETATQTTLNEAVPEPSLAEGEVLEPGELADPRALVPATALNPDQPYSLGEYRWMAAAIAQAVTIPKALQNRPADVLAVMLAGRELGIGPMESTRVIDIINGQTALRGRLKLKFAKKAGHDIRAIKRSARYCRVKCVTHDSEEIEWALTATDAATADVVIVPKEIASHATYRDYPSQMLFWRATGQLIAEHCPEVEGSTMYSSEELE